MRHQNLKFRPIFIHAFLFFVIYSCSLSNDREKLDKRHINSNADTISEIKLSEVEYNKIYSFKSNAMGDHMLSLDSQTPTKYSYERLEGEEFLLRADNKANNPNLIMLNNCRRKRNIRTNSSRPGKYTRYKNKKDFFTSTSPDCSGNEVFRGLGYIWENDPDNIRLPLYNCTNRNIDDRITSISLKRCSGFSYRIIGYIDDRQRTVDKKEEPIEDVVSIFEAYSVPKGNDPYVLS